MIDTVLQIRQYRHPQCLNLTNLLHGAKYSKVSFRSGHSLLATNNLLPFLCVKQLVLGLFNVPLWSWCFDRVSFCALSSIALFRLDLKMEFEVFSCFCVFYGAPIASSQNAVKSQSVRQSIILLLKKNSLLVILLVALQVFLEQRNHSLFGSDFEKTPVLFGC